MDPLLCELDKLAAGPEISVVEGIPRQRFNCLTFADDMAVFGLGRQRFQAALSRSNEYYEKVGMRVNASMSHMFMIQSAGGGRRNRDVKQDFFRGTEVIPVLEPGEYTKYLGLRAGPCGFKRDLAAETADMLEKINYAPLKGLQKVVPVKEYLLPKLLYPCVMAIERQKDIRH